jgi:predicted MFS family arabinose efflux permease
MISAMVNLGIAAGALLGGVMLSNTGVAQHTPSPGALLTALAVAILLSEPIVCHRRHAPANGHHD